MTELPPQAVSAHRDTRTKIVAALMALAAERKFEDITLTDIANQAGVSLADFRDAFPSKGAVLAGFSKMIDRQVLDAINSDLDEEPARERLFDVLMRRLDAMAPYKDALREISAWARREPVSAMALNAVLINSMRFMLEAAHIESEGATGAIKLQGLAFAWLRVLNVWLDDDDPQQDKTMATLDKELERGGRLVARVEDCARLTSPFRTFARALFQGGRDFGGRVRERAREGRGERERRRDPEAVDV